MSKQTPSLSSSSSSLAAATDRSSRSSSSPLPLYITIGPPCAGKTTLLKNMQTGTFKIFDVAIDDQRDIYIPVPTRLFLADDSRSALHTSTALTFQKDTRFLRRRFHSKTMESRIYGDENTELRAVLQRFNGTMSAQEFCHCMERLYQSYRGDTEHAYTQACTDLVDVVEEIIDKAASTATPLTLHNTTDVFCVESIFRPHPRTNYTGLEMARHHLLKFATRSPRHAVAWGNTNTRPHEYKDAMEAAQRTGRPVHFIVYMRGECVVDGSDECLDQMSFKDLLQRSLYRLLATGRYVPAKAILDLSKRVETLVERAMSELEQNAGVVKIASEKDGRVDDDEQQVEPVNTTFTKLELDVVLARFINFEMQPDRTVRYVAQLSDRGNSVWEWRTRTGTTCSFEK